MAFKGKSIIELTDVNTGEVEVHEDENMVTNALATVLSELMNGAIYGLGYSGFGSQASSFNRSSKFGIIPIYGYGIGGILLFEAPQTEDVNHIYPKGTDVLTGYAGNTTNGAQLDNKLGSMDLQNSGPVENGYKFVWDFTTEQANGIISCLALTTGAGGRLGLGNAISLGSDLKAIYPQETGNQDYTGLFRFGCTLFEFQDYCHDSNKGYLDVEDYNRYCSICKVDFESNIAYSCYLIDSNTILVELSHFCSSTLTGNLYNYGGAWNGAKNIVDLFDSFELNFSEDITKINDIGISGNYSFCHDPSDNNIIWFLGSCYKYNSSDKKYYTYLRWVKIDIAKRSGTTGTLSFENPSLYTNLVAGDFYFNFNRDSDDKTSSSSLYSLRYKNRGFITRCLNNFIIWHNKIYISVGYTRIIVINLASGVWESTFSTSDSFNNMNAVSNGSYFTYIKSSDCLFTPFGYFDSEEVFHNLKWGGLISSGNPLYKYGRRFENNGVVSCFSYESSGGFGSTYSRACLYKYVYMPMLHTINNLSSPVQKTVSKTMKITYILTEVNE